MTKNDPMEMVRNPLKLEPGKLIEADGVYDLDMDIYHSQCAAGPSTSSGELRTIWNQSPAHAFRDSSLNPSNWQVIEVDGQKVRVRKDQGDRPHFSLGRAAHHLLFLGKAGFDEEYVVRPERFPDYRTNDAKQWRKDAIAAGLTVITDAELTQIAGMAKSLGALPLVKAGILDGYVERSLIWKCPYTGVWLKSRPDAIPNDSGDVSDLKTSADISDEGVQRTLGRFGYHAQGALVGQGFEAVLKREMTSFSLVLVEIKEPHCARVVTIPPDDIKRGDQQMRNATDIFAECVKTGDWPGPGARDDAQYLGLPAYARTSIDRRLEGLAAADAEYDPTADQPEE